MPELPEVQCLVSALKEEILNVTIVKVVPRNLQVKPKEDLLKVLNIIKPGTHIKDISRVHKRIKIQTELGELIIALGMSGRFAFSAQNKPNAHEHLSIYLNNSKVLAFIDPRRFGFWKVYLSAEFTDVISPLSEASLLDLFMQLKHNKSHKNVKELLLNQKLIGGIGNIYAAEALFSAKISPLKNLDQIETAQLRVLAKIIPEILNKAICAGGSSVKTYKNFNGSIGHFQMQHRVYGKEGTPCTTLKCNTPIVRVEQKGRSSFYCPNCQKNVPEA